MTRLLVSVVGVLSLIAMPLTPHAHAASPPQLYFTQTKTSVTKGESINLSLRINPNGTNLDTLNVLILYPSASLKYNSLNKAGSAFDTFIPTLPDAKEGKLNFSASSLSGKVKSDALVANIGFTALASNGTVDVKLTNSSAANGGNAITTINTSSAVTFGGSPSATKQDLQISNVEVSGVTTTSAVVRWQTNIASTGSVDYGTDSKYGLSASDDKSGTKHSVLLKDAFRGKDTIHYMITATTSDGSTASTNDSTFMTKGYPVKLTVVNSKNKPVEGAKVQIAKGQVATTGSDGIVTVYDVNPGSQSVVINGAPAQLITVKDLGGEKVTDLQSFTLVASNNQPSTIVYIGVAILIGLAALLVIEVVVKSLRKRRS